MKKRSFILASAILPVALAVTGCTSNTNETQPPHASTESVVGSGDTADPAPGNPSQEVPTETEEPSTAAPTPVPMIIPDVPAELAAGLNRSEGGNVVTQDPYIIIGNTMYFHNYYADVVATSYGEALNAYADSMPGELNVYGLIAPASSIVMPEELQAQFGETTHLDHLQSYLNSLNGTSARGINVGPLLSAHKDQYLYFRSDTHWTQLAAYYAYAQFCLMKNQPAPALTEYQTVVGEGFMGAHYAEFGGAATFGEGGDTVRSFIPRSNSDITITDQGANPYTLPVVNTDNASNYMTFINGDHYFSVITNHDKNDGSAALLIKDSYGNPFATFLTDDYNYVYIVDYRMYDQGLLSLIKEKGITDLIVENGFNMTSDVARFMKDHMY